MDRELDPVAWRRRRLRAVVRPAGLALLGAALLIGLVAWLRPAVDRERIRTARVERGPIEAGLAASGIVVPAVEKVISCPIDARVLRILARPGTALEPGMEILELDTSVSRLEVTRLDDRLAQKANERVQLRLDLARSEAELTGRLESQALDVEIVDYRLQQAERLRQDGLIAEEALLLARVEARKAGIGREGLAAAVVRARETAAARLAAITLDLRTLESERREVLRQIDLASTRSDFKGVVTWVVSQEGMTVRRGDVLARVADLTSFRVEATIPDAHASRLRPGLPAEVVADGEVLAGTVLAIDPTIENGAVRFKVGLARPSHPRLKSQLRVEVFVVLEHRPQALKLSKGPFAQPGHRQTVFMVRGDRAERVAASFGLVGRSDIEVLDGLAEGDQVVVSDMSGYQHLPWVRLH